MVVFVWGGIFVGLFWGGFFFSGLFVLLALDAKEVIPNAISLHPWRSIDLTRTRSAGHLRPPCRRLPVIDPQWPIIFND